MNHERRLFGAPSGGRHSTAGNVRLKKAVNFAIDRQAMLTQRGAYAGVTNDQYMPPSMRGFRNVAIYPRRPNLSQARSLSSGQTRGGDGTFYCSNRAPAPATCQIVQANLRNIGLNMDIKLFPRATQFELTGRRGEPFDLTLEGWHMDYFDPYDFIFLVDGTTIRPANNVNFSYFNSAAFNKQDHAGEDAGWRAALSRVHEPRSATSFATVRRSRRTRARTIVTTSPRASGATTTTRCSRGTTALSASTGRSRLNGKGAGFGRRPFISSMRRTRSTSGKLVTPPHQTQERRECTDI